MYPIYHPTNGSGSTFPILSGSFRGGGSATKPILNLLEHLWFIMIPDYPPICKHRSWIVYPCFSQTWMEATFIETLKKAHNWRPWFPAFFFSVWATQWMSYFGQNPPCSWIIIGYPIISPHPIISPFWWLIATATCLDGWLTIFDDWPQRGRVIRRAQPELRQHPLWLERGSLEGQG